jgi:ABC-type lipoprotein export system ATPase subunit
MNVEKHFEILLKKYNLNNLFNKFKLITVIATLIIRGFHWVLIVFSEIIKDKPESIQQFAIILVIIYSLNIPIQRILKYITGLFLRELKKANTDYFNDRLMNMYKSDLLRINLSEYHITLNSFNDNLEQYVMNIKNKYEIPFYYITIIIIAINKRNSLIVLLFVIFYVVMTVLNEIRIKDETPLHKDSIKYENNIRDYILNSKLLLINNETNEEYLNNNIDANEKVKFRISEVNNRLDYNTNIAIVIFITIIIFSKIRSLNQHDFFYYFLVVYDIEYISEKMIEYYKNKVIIRMQERLDYLYKIKEQEYINNNKNDIEQIIINELKNDKPKIEITKPIILKGHILITGDSGSGKTSLLYVLKGIVKPDILNIEPSIENINSQSYITMPNYKSLYNGKLYDIITNYDNNPDIELINYALLSSKINIFNGNQFVNIEKLSSGERVRLYIAQIIYIVKTRNYNILLFDEIDENLNDSLSIEICNNIRNIFNDKIILYISHNKSIKQLFGVQLTVSDGIIY